jgi:putative sterol carrier protein
MTEWFPSEQWLERYREQLNANERYAADSEGWGVDFDGDFLFVVQNLPLEETTVGDLPDDLVDPLVAEFETLDDDELAALRASATDAFATRLAERGEGHDAFVGTMLATPLDDVPVEVWPGLRTHFPDELSDLLGQLEEYVEDGTVGVHVALEDGECQSIDLVTAPDSVETGFELRGRYPVWKELIEGADVIEAVMSRDMQLDGSVTTILEYDDAAAEMGDTAGETPARYLF